MRRQCDAAARHRLAAHDLAAYSRHATAPGGDRGRPLAPRRRRRARRRSLRPCSRAGAAWCSSTGDQAAASRRSPSARLRCSAGPSSTATTSPGTTTPSPGRTSQWTHVIEPWRRGEHVDYRPPGWVAQGREGAVTVPADVCVLVLEGVGAGRASLASAGGRRRLGAVRPGRGPRARTATRCRARADPRGGGALLGRVDGRGGAVPRRRPAVGAGRPRREVEPGRVGAGAHDGGVESGRSLSGRRADGVSHRRAGDPRPLCRPP